MALDPLKNVNAKAAQIIWDLARFLLAITRIAAPGTWVGRGWDSGSEEHGTGRALDYIISTKVGKYPSPAQRAIGWLIANYLTKHAIELHIRHIIWDGKIWKTRYSQQGWVALKGRKGVSDWHLDHLHVFLQDTGGKIPKVFPSWAGAVAPSPLPQNPVSPIEPISGARPFSLGQVQGARDSKGKLWSGNVATLQLLLNNHYLVHKQGRFKVATGIWDADMQRVFDAYRETVLGLSGEDAEGAPGVVSVQSLVGDGYLVA